MEQCRACVHAKDREAQPDGKQDGDRGMAGEARDQKRPWTACPHANELLCEQLRMTIPDIEHLEVEVVDSSDDVVAGHAKGVWLKLVVVSDFFVGLRLVDRHRLVQLALASELASGAVEALPELQTLSGAQWRSRLARRRIEAFEAKVRVFVPDVEFLEILDLSDGHAVQGFFDGSRRSLDPDGLELKVTVVSAAFEGKRPLVRQQLIQEAFGPEILSGKIHALPSLRALTPVQWQTVLAKAAAQLPAGCAKL